MTTDRIRKIVVAGILSGISIFLGATRLGFIPVPTPAGSASIMHIPAIIGAILEGPVVGCVVGTIFGLFSFFQATVPLFKDPLVSILPRMFIGVTAYFAYAALRRRNEVLAIGVGSAIGAITNTVLVLGMAVLRKYMALPVAGGVAVMQGLPMMIVTIIIGIAILVPWKRIATGKKARQAKL